MTHKAAQKAIIGTKKITKSSMSLLCLSNGLRTNKVSTNTNTSEETTPRRDAPELLANIRLPNCVIIQGIAKLASPNERISEYALDFIGNLHSISGRSIS
jgi:hypothetical protein